MSLSSTRAARARHRLVLATTVIAGAMIYGAFPLQAALLVHEPFDYADDTILDQMPATGLNLTGVYAATEPQWPPQFQLRAQSPGLTYGNLTNVPGVSGNRLNQVSGTTAGGVSVGIDQDVSVNPGEAIYFAALFTFDDSQNGNHRASVTLTDDATGDELTFGESAVGVRNIRIAANTAATGELQAAGADNAFENGQTLLLLARYTNSAADNEDVLELIGYDTADTDALPTSFDPTDSNAEFAYTLDELDIDMTTFTTITFNIRGNGNNFIDELRIGSTYASVVPEPSAVLLMLFATGLARRR